MISEQNSIDKKIITIENPVEYNLPMVRQTQVDDNNNFAQMITSTLRQDPDIVMVGEIRDEIGAKATLKAALTGHKVYSSLHANNCIGAIYRLMDFEMSFSALMSVLRMVMAQRLIRKVCKMCCRVTEISKPEQDYFEQNNITNTKKNLYCHWLHTLFWYWI